MNFLSTADHVKEAKEQQKTLYGWLGVDFRVFVSEGDRSPLPGGSFSLIDRSPPPPFSYQQIISVFHLHPVSRPETNSVLRYPETERRLMTFTQKRIVFAGRDRRVLGVWGFCV